MTPSPPAPPAPTSVLDIRIDRKRFPDVSSGGERTILQDIRFTVEQGEFVALVGPSGCGKSTLLHIVAGLDQDYQGEIRWPSTQQGGKPRLGYVFQNPRLLPWLNVRDNIALVLDKPARHGERIDAILEGMGLGEFGRFHPNRISLGMQRRAALARAFVLEPDLLLMDEPFVSLDVPTADQLRRLLLTVWSTHRSTVIFVTHDLHEATMLADRILFMSTSPAAIVADVDVGIPRPSRIAEGVISERYGALKALFDTLYVGQAGDS